SGYYSLFAERVMPANLLRAMYFTDPDIAASIVAGFGFGQHGFYSNILNPRQFEASQRRYGMEPDMILALIIRGLDLFHRHTERRPRSISIVSSPEVAGQSLHVRYNLAGIAGVLASWEE